MTAQWWFGAKLSLSPGSVSENGGSQKVTVTADVSEWGTSSEDISYEVTVGKGGDSAVSGTDYQAVSKFRINIKSGRRSGSNSFYLQPIADTDWEGDETITIHASGPDGSQSTTLTLTDEGDRPYSGPQVTLSANPSTVSEADGATTVTVTAASASHSVSRNVKVSVGGGGTATSGTDYAAVSDFTITIGKNATSATGTFTLTPTQDKWAEGDETITVAGQVNGSTGKLTGTTLTLTDDDKAPNVTLSVSPSSVTENGGAKTVTVTATASTAAVSPLTMLVQVGNRQDTATSGTDYTVVPAFNITIAASATTATGTFSLTPTNDTSVEDTESISIDGMPESSGAVFTVGGTAMTLTDDDALPAVTLSATPSSVGEAALATAVTVKATAASAVAWARTVTVSVGSTGSAASGTDYAAVSNFTITIAANATSGTGTFTLTPTQDTTNEGNETIGVAGTGPRTTVTGTTVTLADDDINPAVTLSVSPSSVSEGASATSVTVTATAASAITSARTVSVKVGASGTAMSGTDYAAVSDFTITIAANATSGTGTFTLTPTQDTAVEGGETISVAGTSTSSTVTGTTVALADDDTYPAVTLSVNPSSVSEGASATSVTVTATAASAISSARTVTVSVGQTGTAAPASDYAAVTDFTITIAANATSGTGAFTLAPTQDSLFEHSETIGVSGSSPNTTVTNATITLADDEKDAVTLSLNRSVLGEEASATSVTATATAATAIAVARTVTVSVGDTGTATSGTDYAAVTDFAITIAANSTSGTGTFTLTPTNDTSNEGNETIGIAGTNSHSTVTGTTLTLVDDEQPTITLTSNKSGWTEGWSGTVTVTATRPGNSTGSAASVTVAVGADTDSATEGEDYQAVDDFTITIPAGQTSATGSFTYTGIADTVADNHERVTLWGVATGYKVSGETWTIVEWATTVGLSADVSSVNESDGPTTVTVTLTAHPTVYGNLPVTVSVGGGTATSGTDYAAVSNFTLTLPNKTSTVTGTFTLTPTQDSLLESDETININGHGAHWSAYNGKGTSITLTDAQPIALAVHPSSVSEGAPGTQVAVSATATGTMSTPRTVTVSVGDTGTATSGTDYAAVSDFDITIPANKTGATNTFTLTPTKDSASEGDETIGVAGSSTVAYVYPTTLTLADTNPAVTLTAAPSSISEGASGTSVTVTATAASALASARTVTVTVGDTGTATSGTDYAAVSDFTITIAANAKSGTGTFTLTPTDDTALEGDETIGVAGTSSEAATISGTTLTLTDDDLPTITLATVPANVAVNEGAGLSSVTVRATAAAAMKAKTTVTLTVGSSGDSATKTTDYTTSNVRTITIPKGQSTAEASFELTPKQDTSVEGDETVSVSGSSSGGHTVIGTSLTLTDDDKHAITLSASPSSVGEEASATSVTVTATAKSAISSVRTVTVSVGGSGTATSGTDYAAVSNFTITIAANATSGTGTFTLTPTQDTKVEGDETIGVGGSSTNSTVTGTTVTLTDDDSYPAITLSANPSSVSEGASGTSVTVTATAASAISSARDVTVSVGGSGTASRGTDYATVADFTVTIAANATSGTGTFTLTPTQDTEVEGSETIGVAGTSPSSTVTGTTVTLTDDDSHAITLSASPSTVAENKASETVTVTATLNVARTAATTVSVSVGDSTDEATSGTDYKAVSDFTVTIAANATSGTGTFAFEPKTDTAYEGFESVSVSGTTSQSGGGVNAQSGSTSIPVTGTSLSIHDASNYPAITLTAAPTSVSEGASATSVTVTATAASAIASSREVTVSVGGSGTATSGTDYAAVSDFIIKIAANGTSATGTFTLTPTQDTVVEGSETIGVSGTSLSTTVTGTTVTLTDDDAVPAVNLSLNPSSLAEDASGTQVTVTGTFSNTNTYAADQTVSVSVGGSGTATSGADYAAVSNFDVTISKGQTSGTGTFTLTPTDDTLVEGDETIGVAGSVTGLTVNGTTLTLTDNDAVPAVNLSLNPSSVSEGASGTSVTVTAAFSNTSTYAVDQTVSVSVGDSGTATSGTDYAAVSDFDVTIGKGKTSGTATFTLTPTDDTLVEGNETIGVGGSVTGLTVNGSDLRLTDDDGEPAVNLSLNPSSVSEGSSGTSVTVTAAFSNTSTYEADQTVTVSVGGSGTATSGTDYAAVSNFDVTIGKGKTSGTATFTLTPTDDTLVEGNETIGVGGSVTGLTVNGTTLALTDDDAVPAVNLSLNPSSVGEGASGTQVTVTAAFSNTNTYTADKAVTVSVGGSGTATSGTDYAAVSNFDVTISKGKTSGTATFTLTPTDDTLIEGNETIGVGGSATGLTVNGATLALTDDDAVPAVTLSLSPSSVGESEPGTQVTVTATFSNTNTYEADQTVTVSVGGSGTAISGTDYAAVSNFDLTISKGKTSGTATFTLTPTDDYLDEVDETIGVAGSTAGLTVNGTTLTLTDDDTAALVISKSSVNVDEDGGTATYTMALATQPTADVTVTPASGDTGVVTVSAALKFTATTWSSKQTVTVTGVGDDIDNETNRTAKISHTVAGGDYSGVTAADMSVTAIDNDVRGITVSPASASASEKRQTAKYAVVLDSEPTGSVTVTPSSADTTVATVYGTLTFTAANWFAPQTVTVIGVDDSIDNNPDRRVKIGFQPSGADYSGVTQATADFTAIDDESPAVIVSRHSVQVSEKGGTATYTVALSTRPTGGKVTVTPGSGATSVATVSGALTFTSTNWFAPQTVTVTGVDDSILNDPNRSTSISHSVAGGDYDGVAAASVAVAAIDDEAPALIVSRNSVSVAENGGTGTYTVVLSTKPTDDVTVTPASGDTSTATVSGALTFTSTTWSSAQTVTVKGVDDSIFNDPDRVAKVTHGVSGGGYGGVKSAFVAVTAVDDEFDTSNFGVPTISVSNGSGPEGGGPITFLVQLSAAVGDPVTVSGVTREASATEGEDYTGTRETLTIAAGATQGTFSVPVLDDREQEGDEAFELRIVEVLNAEVNAADAVAIGTILDDDGDDPLNSPQPRIVLWTDRLGYKRNERVRVYRDIDPMGDWRQYVAFYYRENIDTGERRYLAPATRSTSLRRHVVDDHGRTVGSFLPRRLARAEKELIWEGQLPDAGRWHFAMELRNPGTTQVVNAGYAKFVVADRGTLLVNRPGVDRTIATDTRWTSDTMYLLRHRVIVRRGATLAIEAGTLILSYGPTAEIIVEPGGRIAVAGRREAPVVMTCDMPPGERAPGCWGGLRVLGRARAVAGPDDAETLSADPVGAYGGDRPGDSSGALRYLRVEFAGAGPDGQAASPAVAFHGVGAGTVIDHVQAHSSLGDGIEFRGGTAHCGYCVSSSARQDSLVWSQGWNGTAQHLYVQQGQEGGSAIQGTAEGQATPERTPLIYNATLVGGYYWAIGPGVPGSLATIGPGILLNGGAAVTLRNLMVLGFADHALDTHDSSPMHFVSGRSSLRNAIFFSNGAKRRARHVPNDVASYVDYVWNKPNVVNVRYEPNPDPRPKGGSAARRIGVAAVPPAGGALSRSAQYLGAFGGDNWLREWTFFGDESDYQAPVH